LDSLNQDNEKGCPLDNLYNRNEFIIFLSDGPATVIMVIGCFKGGYRTAA
jgi:hypothetical protein